MLELEIPESAVKPGKTHNAYQYAKVAGRLDIKSLCAVYHVEHTGHWYYKRTIPEKFFVNDPCIPKTLDTRALKFYGLYDEITSDDDPMSRCAYCESKTVHRSGNLLLCSRYCEDRIIRLYKKYFGEQDINNNIIFNKITSADVRNMKMGRSLVPACTLKMDIF